jgi:hypothetical protein
MGLQVWYKVKVDLVAGLQHMFEFKSSPWSYNIFSLLVAIQFIATAIGFVFDRFLFSKNI